MQAVVLLTAASTVPNSPAAQLVHVPAPLALYVPRGHCTAVPLVDPAGHAYPAVHVPLHIDDDDRPVSLAHFPAAHRVQLVLPVALVYCPGLHGTQPLEPAAALKVPAAQEGQVDVPPALYLPAEQMDAVALVEPEGQAYPAEQLPEHALVVLPESRP